MANYVYLDARSTVTTTRDVDPSDSWDVGDDSTDWSFGSILRDGMKGYDDVCSDYLCAESLKPEDLTKGKDYWVYVAVWSTGCSFGHNAHYHASIVGIFKSPKEDKFLKEATYSWKPWEGYFESLSYISEVRAHYRG